MVEYENMRCAICDMKMNVDDLLRDDEALSVQHVS